MKAARLGRIPAHEICLQKATWELEKLKNLFTNEKR